MKTIIFSLDTALIELIKKLDSIFTKQLIFYQGSTDPLDVMSFVCSEISSILIIDDDFLKPNTAHILRSVRKLHKKVKYEGNVLLHLTMQRPDFSSKLAILLSDFFTLCNLRRTKFIFEGLIMPKKARDEILALMYQAKIQELLQREILTNLAKGALKIDDKRKQEASIKEIIETLDLKIDETRKHLTSHVKLLKEYNASIDNSKNVN